MKKLQMHPNGTRLPLFHRRNPSDAETDCELPDAWCHPSKEFVETPDHNYDRKAIEIALTVDANEICEDGIPDGSVFILLHFTYCGHECRIFLSVCTVP